MEPLAAAETALADADRENLGATTASDRLGGDLAGLVTTAVAAFHESREDTAGLLDAARTAVAGGADGCRGQPPPITAHDTSRVPDRPDFGESYTTRAS